MAGTARLKPCQFRGMAGDRRCLAPCDELASNRRGFSLASCCTCAPAMLAKPRF